MSLLAQAVNQPLDATPFVFGGGMMLVILVLGVIGLALWIWALVDAIQNPSLDPTMKIIWVLVILLTNWLGALIYLVAGRTRRLT